MESLTERSSLPESTEVARETKLIKNKRERERERGRERERKRKERNTIPKGVSLLRV